MLRNKHYAWIILIVCCVVRIGAYGMIACPAGLYNTPVCYDLGFPMGQFVMSSTINALAMMITQPFASKVYKKIDMKKIMFVSGIIYGISSFLMGNCTRLEHWYVLAVLQGIFGGLFNGSAVYVIICRWFYDKTAYALGMIEACGFGVGMLMNPIVSLVIQKMGWRFSYHLFSSICLLISLPMILLIRNAPEDYDMKPYVDNAKENDNIEYKYDCRYDTKNLIFLSSFLIVFATICNASGGYYQHIPSYCLSIGLGFAAGSLLSSLELAGVFSFKLIIGPQVDKIGIIKSELVLYILSFIGFILFMMTANMYLLYVAAFFSGVFSATNGVLLPIFAREQLGSQYYQDVIPWISTAIGIFSALSTTVFGYFFDMYGSYELMFIACIICNTVSLLCIFMVRKLEKN